jgi:thioredoxin reductase (NADPH)
MHDKTLIYDTIVIGGGVTGLAAAMYAGRFQMNTLVLGETTGGTIILTDIVENYPGFKRLTGLELAEKIKEHALDYNIELKEDRVEKMRKCKEGCFTVATSKQSFHTKTIIFATGTEWRKLGVPGEEEFANKGVHYCALCDGAFYRDKVIGVVGGSDSAAKEALLLAGYGKKVYIIYRGEKIRPEPINRKRVEENGKIEVIPRTNVVEIKGDEFVKSVVLDRPYEGKRKLSLDAVFVEIGHIPLSQLAKDIGVDINEKGEIRIDRASKTNVRGVFAAGDVVDSGFKQAITGVAEGVTAAYSAYNHVNQDEIICVCDDEEL